ncbi:MAG: hypothetical protein JO230_27855 [Xanthobacteraceae bacterium]|nr:hypothetical protein [Xanthobacteraceae bacterium]
MPEPIAIGILQHSPEQAERLLLGCRQVGEFNSVGIEIRVIVHAVEVKKVRHRLPLLFFMKAAGGLVFPIDLETAVESAGSACGPNPEIAGLKIFRALRRAIGPVEDVPK